MGRKDKGTCKLVDHVINHGVTMADPGHRVQPNVGRIPLFSIIQAFNQENRCVSSEVMCTVYSYSYSV